jgi:tryptophan halogenase
MKIVIVGGGTAGWLAALMITKICGAIHNVTLIESSSVGIIGAGESSTGALRGILNNEVFDYGCNEFEFMATAKATPKYAIHHKDWNGVGTDYIAPIDTTIDESYIGTNFLLSAYIAQGIPMQHASVNGRLVDSELTDFYLEDNKILSANRHAYNFDARLAAKYLEKKCSTNIKKIDAKIIEINLKENGFVESVLLDTGLTVSGDFYIDASGFAKIFSKKLGISWIDYKELTLNAAMPFILPYEKDKNHKFLATSWAQKYGWMWCVPKLDDLGCGYAYDDRFIDEEQAKKEIESVLQREIVPIKKIKFSPGRMESVWNKNVLSIGLAASFLEPLEATSIHGTILQLNMFIFTHLKETLDRTINDVNTKIYNETVSKIFDEFKIFLLIHYKNNRKDTDFWIESNRLVSKNSKVAEVLEIAKTRLLTQTDVDNHYGCAGAELYNWILCGLGHYSKETAILESKLLQREQAAINEEKKIAQQVRNKRWLTNQEYYQMAREIANANR